MCHRRCKSSSDRAKLHLGTYLRRHGTVLGVRGGIRTRFIPVFPHPAEVQRCHLTYCVSLRLSFPLWPPSLVHQLSNRRDLRDLP